MERIRFKYSGKLISFSVFYDESRKATGIRFEGPSSGSEKQEFNRACVCINDLLAQGITSSLAINRSLDNVGRVSSSVLECMKKVVRHDLGLGQ